MADLALVMPMAGRGSRFARQGVVEPKPLVSLAGKPFFWWAVESVRRMARIGELVCVVLEEHVRDFAIDRRIAEHYPDARIVALPAVTGGAAETAAIGLEAVSGDGPVAVNDSDHAFRCTRLGEAAASLGRDSDAALLCFRSDDPAYSYVRLDRSGTVVGTVEKRVASDYAIAGCYLFSSPSLFRSAYQDYRLHCPYGELFVSGIYNRLIASGHGVDKYLAEPHLSFGTPEELARLAGRPVEAEIWGRGDAG